MSYPNYPNYPPTGGMPGYPPSQPAYGGGGPLGFEGASQAAPGGYPSYPPQQQPGGYPGYPPAGGAAPPYGAPAPSYGAPASYPGGGAPGMQNPYGGGGGYPPQQQQQPGGGYPMMPGQPTPAFNPYQQQPQMGPTGGYPPAPGGGYGGAGGYPQQPPQGQSGLAYGHQGGPPPQWGQPAQSAGQGMAPMHYNQGTVRDFPGFNANSDADTLRKAMKGLGCDSKAITNVLCYRSNQQRQQIRHMYKTMFGKDLIQDLISELRGNMEDMIVALMYTPGEFDARELRDAMSGAGTNEATLIEIMCTRTNQQIRDIRAAYSQLFHRDLERDLMSETSGHFRRLLVSCCAAGRDESMQTDPNRAREDAKRLYQAGTAHWGTDESTFNAILASQNYQQLQLVFQEYHRQTGKDIEAAIKGEFSGDIEDGMMTMVRCAKNRSVYFAERLHQAMAGMGTKDKQLIRVVVTRCEVDMVPIKQEFQRMYGKPLETFIRDDTSGKYRDALVALVTGH